MMSSEHSVQPCPGCGSESLDSGTDIPGEVCQGCGLVHDGSNWAYNSVGNVEVGVQSGSENETSSDWQNEITIRDASDQQIVRILSEVDDLADHLSLDSEEREIAVEFAVETWGENLMHGRELESMIASVVYTACRKSGHPRPIHIVAKAAGIGETKLQNASSVIIRELDWEMNPPGAKEYIPYLNTQFDLPDQVERDAAEILQNAGTIGGNPAAIAAAALYTATQDSDSLTLQEAGQAAGVSKETVWRHSTEFEQ